MSRMIRSNMPTSWSEVPPFVVVRVLRNLRAGVLYAPQDFVPALSDLAFRCCDSSDAMAIAVEGLDLALHIGDELALDYCVYNDEQETIRSVERAALGRLRSPAR